MVVVLDGGKDANDILRKNRSREKRYAFDVAFDETATQNEVFETSTRFLVEGVLNGFNATVFAYGATGSGKTYTMLGTQYEPGLMFLTLQNIFDVIDQRKEELKYKVIISYLEVSQL